MTNVTSRRGNSHDIPLRPALAVVDDSLVEDGILPAGGNVSFNTGVSSDFNGDEFAETEREFDTRPLVGLYRC